MTNIERGEVDFTVADKTYTLKLSMNAACALETRSKKRIGEILASCESLDFTAIRDILFVLLQKHHARQFPTLTEVGNLIDDAGGVMTFFAALRAMTVANEPDAESASASGEKKKGPKGADDPLDAQGGDGDASTSKPGV